MDEAQTRKAIIDKRLFDAGWDVTDRTQVIEEFDIIIDNNLVQEAATPYAGHQFSDYVLLGKNGKPLAGNRQNNIATIYRKHKVLNFLFVFIPMDTIFICGI